jgi:hypothetical protein
VGGEITVEDEANILRTGRDGIVEGVASLQADAIMARLQSSPEVVIHLHGGLVDEARGLRKAHRLTDRYVRAGAYPIFVVWQSGLMEVLQHNLNEIAREELFNRMFKRVLQYTVGKLRQGPGERAAGALPVPNDVAINAELGSRAAGAEPYAVMRPPLDLSAVSEAERRELELAVETDPQLLDSLTEVLEARHPESATEGSRGIVVRREASAASLIDPEVLDEIDRGRGGERGLLSTLVLAKKCGAVLVRAVTRFRSQTDHGVYPTVMEELLREFYLANAGGAIWSAMKKETLDTFEPAEPVRGGRLLLDLLAAAFAAGAHPRITLVGHSTGAVYIDHLLTEVARGRNERYRPWPDEARFSVVFLAPACTYAHFGSALRHGQSLIQDLRMFTTDDAHERDDRLVGAIYPRSLLYLVSGILERDDNRASAVMPVVGMALPKRCIRRY